jgi:hypothetical protein
MTNPEQVSEAIAQLYTDALEIYEVARREVTIEKSDGTSQKYAATRYKQQIDKGYSDGILVATIANIVKKRTSGFGHLEAASRPDLMLETLVLDERKSYHRLFSPNTVRTARERMNAYRATARERH